MEGATEVGSTGGDDAQTYRRIYIAVVKAILMYGSETWVRTPSIGRVLGGFHYRVTQRLRGQQPRKGG